MFHHLVGGGFPWYAELAPAVLETYEQASHSAGWPPRYFGAIKYPTMVPYLDYQQVLRMAAKYEIAARSFDTEDQMWAWYRLVTKDPKTYDGVALYDVGNAHWPSPIWIQQSTWSHPLSPTVPWARPAMMQHGG